MRNLLIGVVVGMLIGALGAFGYSHYLVDAPQLAQVQADLASAKSTVAKDAEDTKQFRSENEALSAQVDQLSAKNNELKQQVAAAGPAAAVPATPNPMAGFMKAAMAQRHQQRLAMLKSRLHLTPEQEAALEAAMDQEDKLTDEMTSKIFSGGKIDFSQATKGAGGLASVEKTLQDILTPEQKTEYAQMQADEKNSANETMATVQMNQMAPMLNLSDSQKDQVYNALYQVQQNSQDPNWIKNNIPAGSDPGSILDAQAKAKADALSKILTPDQMTIYNQQAQSQLDLQKTMMQKFTSPTATVPGSVSTSVTVTPGP